MSDKKYLTSPPEVETMPTGVPYIVGNEAAERFSYYGMKTVLAVFMTKYLLDASGNEDFMSDEEATKWIHYFNAAVYLFPIVGAILSDWLFGKYRTILWLSIVYCIGHAVLALMELSLPIDQRTILFWGLALIAIGSGGIKPCVSAHVGDQFGRKNQFLLPVVFAWFYFSINFGSTISTLLTPYLRDTYGPSVAFAVPGILMGLATIFFWMGRHEFVHIPASGNHFWSETFSREGIRAMKNLIPLFLFVAMFWALFDQTASRWVLQAQHMDRELFSGFSITSDQMQAANPILVMIMIQIFARFLYPFLNRFFTLTPLRKVGMGMFLALPSFMIPAWLEQQIIAGATPHIIWQLLAYIFLTAAEVMISITCLEFAYTQSPNKMKSYIMSLYLLFGIASGNLFTAFVNGYMESQHKAGVEVLPGASYYWFFTGCMAATAVLYVIWAQFYKGETYIQESVGAAPEGDSNDAS